MDDRVGVGIIGIDAERLRQPCAPDWIAVKRKRRSMSRVATKRTQREQNTQTPS
jgi:hypothetical protein